MELTATISLPIADYMLSELGVYSLIAYKLSYHRYDGSDKATLWPDEAKSPFICTRRLDGAMVYALALVDWFKLICCVFREDRCIRTFNVTKGMITVNIRRDALIVNGFELGVTMNGITLKVIDSMLDKGICIFPLKQDTAMKAKPNSRWVTDLDDVSVVCSGKTMSLKWSSCGTLAMPGLKMPSWSRDVFRLANGNVLCTGVSASGSTLCVLRRCEWSKETHKRFKRQERRLIAMLHLISLRHGLPPDMIKVIANQLIR